MVCVCVCVCVCVVDSCPHFGDCGVCWWLVGVYVFLIFFACIVFF